MYRVIYVSSESSRFSDAQLNALLEQSRRNNIAAEITGLLLYKDGNFMQILEGPEQAVLALLAKIKKDSRHWDVTVLMQAKIPHRDFSEWLMGFKKLGPKTSRSVPGYVDFDKLALTSKRFLTQPSQSLSFLLSFKEPGSKPPRRG